MYNMCTLCRIHSQKLVVPEMQIKPKSVDRKRQREKKLADKLASGLVPRPAGAPPKDDYGYPMRWSESAADWIVA